MPDHPPTSKDEEESTTKEELKTETVKKRAKILEERDIPFEEERPPNFSPFYQIKVHRVRRHEEPQEVDE